MRIVTIAMVMGFASQALAEEPYAKDTETYLINYMVRMKEPTTATILSLTPGFGAGHFYSEEYATGVIMFVGQAIGVGLLVLGPRVEGTAGSVLGITGIVLFSGFKIADIYLAPFSAAEHNKKLAKNMRVKAISFEVPTPREDKLALGLALELDLGS
jgi:hypothetical protein